MADTDSLEGLRSLHRDLLAFSESRLPILERLWAELEATLQDFRKLLDKPPKNDQSRQTLSSGTIQIGENEYSVNEEFKQSTLQLADALNLDELEAARLIISAQEDSEELDRSLLECSIIRYHERRQFLLECLRLVLKQSLEVDNDENLRDVFREVVALILQPDESSARNGSPYWLKCVTSMAEIERWLQDLADRIRSASVLGSYQLPEIVETLDHQRASLIRQHESLGAILSYIIKANQTTIEDFEILLAKVKTIDKYDIILVHYVPAVAASLSQFGSSEGTATLQEARRVNEKVTANKDADPWALRYLQAAVVAWWLAEYSGLYLDNPVGSPLHGIDLEAEAEARSRLFWEALHDGAFHFTLSLNGEMKSDGWYDPARQGLCQFLLQETPALPIDSISTSESFHIILMEQFESFADAFISNMPDTLRRLKLEEDQQRKQVQSGIQGGLQRGIVEHELYLEMFLVIMSYAFEHRPEAAQAFWSDPDGNLYGFLQWASKRQSTPRVSAFCEMLTAVSEGTECADSAHKFLLEEGPTASGRLRRSSSLSWAQIFTELQFYASKIRDRPAAAQPPILQAGKVHPDEIDEPESAMMLECYLRLTAHICRESSIAKSWILSHPTFHLVDTLFLLCSSAIPSRLRACALTTLHALLTSKTPELAETIWSSLDQWISGGSSPTSSLAKTSSIGNAPIWAEEVILETIATGFEEPNAFVGLVQALVSPYAYESSLNDSLPFSELLGSAYRMPGIEPYIDFSMGRVFGMKTTEIQDIVQLRILRCTCLDFIVTCLSTFNEDLVIFASRSNISVDFAMRTSSLMAYTRLHPFARVMEWLFNERVLGALFDAAHQDPTDVSQALPDTPLVLGLLRSIEVMNLIMDLQTTYLDIVKPLMKEQPQGRKAPVANSALTSFEDSVLNNLQLIVDLGLYCGMGHQNLTISSLKLLEKLSASRKLVSSPAPGFDRLIDSNKMIGILDMQNESDRIARSLAAEMRVDARELSEGFEAPGYIIKISILEFLSRCLKAFPDRPTIAHSLLGFSCSGNNVEVLPEGLFAKNISLFHAVLQIVLQYPDGAGDGLTAWLMRIKQDGWQVLRQLWTSQLSSIYTMTELRSNDFLFALVMQQAVLDLDTLWDGRSINDPQFLYTTSAACYADFLHQRASLLQYAATELRLVVQQGAPSLKTRILSTLLGSTPMPNGEPVTNVSVFDMFDFVEFEPSDNIGQPALRVYADVDFSICIAEATGSPYVYDLRSAEELLNLRKNELRRKGLLPTSVEEEQIDLEAQDLLMYLNAENQRREIRFIRLDTMKAWTQLLLIILESSEFEQGTKTNFILQALQVVLPKLEKYSVENVIEATELALLTKSLLFNLDFDSSSFDRGRVGDVANDRLFQVFRVCLRGIHSPIATAHLREIFYNICYKYLTGMADASHASMIIRRHSTQTVRAAGDRLIDVICDDAYAGDKTCSVSALLLLDALVSLAEHEHSKYIVTSLLRVNFIGMLVEGIKTIPSELRDTDAQDVPLLLLYYETKLSLLLRVSHTRFGATHVLNVGLFQSIRESQLFAIDPDLGVDIDNPQALKKYYELLLGVLRVINTVVVSRGQQNQHSVEQARKFLMESRYSMVAVFKRHAKLGGLQQELSGGLEELVESFVLLVSMTNFLDFEERSGLKKSASKIFA